MLNRRLGDIAQWTRGRLHGGDEETCVSGVAIDSRRAQAGDLFVALPGERVDGHDYLAAAAAAGAVAALVTHAIDVPLAQIEVEDAIVALGRMGAAVRRRRAVKVVGITGSNGKTTTKRMVTAILSLAGPTHASAGNHNNEIGVPLSLLALPEDARWAVIEMGAGKPGDIAWLAAMALPDVAVVTQIAPAHLERMGSVAQIAHTKGALYAALPLGGVAVINADDAFAAQFRAMVEGRRVLNFGFGDAADVGAQDVVMTPDGSRFTLHTPGGGDVRVELALAGRHNIANALAAAAVALACDLPLATIAAGLGSLHPMAGRLRARAARSGARIIDDSYNANPTSMEAGIEALALHGGERWLVIGDMAELGTNTTALHAQVGHAARAAGIDRLLAVGDLSAHAVAAFGAGAEHFADQNTLIEALRPALHTGVTLLVKGSRSAGMDRVVEALAADDNGDDAHVA